MLTPLVSLFGYDVSAMCPFPFLSNKFDVTVSHVESINILYVQDCREADNLADYLDELYEFYGKENEGKWQLYGENERHIINVRQLGLDIDLE